MKNNTFCALPSKWILDNGLKEFRLDSEGKIIAALKILLTLNLVMDFHSKETCRISYSDIEKVTQLSRPMIRNGLSTLIDKHLISVNCKKSENKGLIYKFNTHGSNGWARIPKDKLIGFLKGLRNRGRNSSASLKIYLTLASLRNNQSDIANIGYEKLREYTGLQSKDIRSAIETLFEYKMISVYQELDDLTRKYKSNSYVILGR